MNKELKKDLIKSARINGMCRFGKHAIRHAKDKDELAVHYKDFIVWQIHHDNPPEDILRKYFEGYCNEWAAVGTNAEFENQPKVLLTCGAKGIVTYSVKKRGRVFVRHGSSLVLKAENGTMVVVSLYDDCTAHIEAEDGARVYVFLHDFASLKDTNNKKEIIISKK
jgi:hypothetical protein